MHFLGLAGMPRRIPDYSMQFANFNEIASIGAFGFGLTQLIFLYVVIKCIKGGEKAPDRPWEGADTLEWTLPSPPAVSQLRDAAGRQVRFSVMAEPSRPGKLRTALILASIALAFFIGVIVRHWLW
jgi:heme/copper-type cytochrome/quinol oxidase subunit 1